MTREEEIRLVAELAAMLELYAGPAIYRTPTVRDLLQQAKEFARHDGSHGRHD